MAITDKLTYVGLPGSATYFAAPGHIIGSDSDTLQAWIGWPAGAVHYDVYTTELDNGKEVVKPGTRTQWKAVHDGSGSLSDVTLKNGTDQNYPSGPNNKVVITHSAIRENEMVEALLTEHNQDGTHKNITTNTMVTTGNVTIGGTLTIGGTGSGGWDPITGTVTAVTANGNRSYSLTTSANNTGLITPGMRLRTTRTVAAPITCFSLNGTNQYFSKSSPAGMTFTDDFAVSAWVYLTQYQSSTIVSRFNGTNGWNLEMGSDGTIWLVGWNGGAANNSYIKSSQSLPLNKWVHISAQLDMSAFTATATTSYIMFDGVDITASVFRGGTNPIALVQAGNFEIGSRNGGLQIFPGKIAQVAVYSAKVTQATIRASMNQGLIGTETNLISAYSGANLTDLNTTNANNLTANNSAVSGYAAAPFGNNGVSTTLDYALVMTVSASSITAQVPEGCTIPTTGGVSAVSYSSVKTPFGFPSETGKWDIEYKYKTQVSITVSSISVWYPFTQIQMLLPVGKFDCFINAWGQITATPVGFLGSRYTFATANNAQTNDNLTCVGADSSASVGEMDSPIIITGNIINTTATPWYFNGQPNAVNGTTLMYVDGRTQPAIFRFRNAYL